MSKRPTVNVYVDGFNLYNRALRNGPHKWLDLEAMSQRLLPHFDVHRIRYFTARVQTRPQDPEAPVRQNAYLRAISVNQRVSIHYGQFLVTKPRMPVHPLRWDEEGNLVCVQVRKTEEKGSDVNIATYMMLDAFRSDADAYVLVSNDSDLAETLRLLSTELMQTTGIIFPVKNPSNELLKTSPHIVRQIRQGVLRASQLPSKLRDNAGTIHKPSTW
jgi:uncharacterized LabA/DUF88 family protein